jgi:predicted alpha/beta-fold hydrolase
VRLQALYSSHTLAHSAVHAPPSGAARSDATGHALDPSAPQKKRLAVLLHGWEGSADSPYVVSLAQALFACGFDVARLNLRDHGSTHHLNRELFHSCRLPEVIGALRALQALNPQTPMYLAGFSLGGNFMLRAAARAEQHALNIERVVAVSPVLDPAETLHALESTGGPYHGYFVRKWAKSLLKKETAWPDHYDFAAVVRGKGLRYMTAELVRRFTEYPSLEAYLNGYAITGDVLANLAVPSHIIVSNDDPIIPIGALQRVARPKALRITTTVHGGHCGFVEALNRPSWAEERIVEEFCSAQPAAATAPTRAEAIAATN